MKELRRNMRFVGVLVVVTFLFLSGSLALTVFEQGSIWASSSYNTRLGNTSAIRGDILDRNGVVLATSASGNTRTYFDNAAIRRALAVTVGDTAGMSGTGVEGYYSSTLLDISDSLVERLGALFNGKERKGSSVELTIDAKLTAKIAEMFPDGYRGAVCVTNYRTGEVLAMVSAPDYDPYSLDTAQDTAYLNRCLQGLYTPGSVFKIVTLAAALEHDPGVMDQQFSCSGVWEYEGGRIVCAGRNAHGEVDLPTAFAKSCNVTFGKLAYQLGNERLRETSEKLGFNENFKLGDFAIYNSKFPTEKGSMDGLVWSGVGQSTVLITPMHMNMITASVANGGQMVKPWLAKRITSGTGVVSHVGEPSQYRQVIGEDTAKYIAKCMYEAVEKGTATRAKIDGVKVCGKTGSAEISDDKSVETHSWYTGYIAESAHPYVVSVVVEQGGAGAKLATELAAKALRATMDYVG